MLSKRVKGRRRENEGTKFQLYRVLFGLAVCAPRDGRGSNLASASFAPHLPAAYRRWTRNIGGIAIYAHHRRPPSLLIKCKYAVRRYSTETASIRIILFGR